MVLEEMPLVGEKRDSASVVKAESRVGSEVALGDGAEDGGRAPRTVGTPSSRSRERFRPKFEDTQPRKSPWRRAIVFAILWIVLYYAVLLLRVKSGIGSRRGFGAAMLFRDSVCSVLALASAFFAAIGFANWASRKMTGRGRTALSLAVGVIGGGAWLLFLLFLTAVLSKAPTGSSFRDAWARGIYEYICGILGAFCIASVFCAFAWAISMSRKR